jgi:uncharacterized membrane protein
LNRIRAWWSEVRSSLWFLPALMTLGAVGLAIVTVWLDQHGFGSPEETSWFILIAGAEGARGVLGTVAGSIITVTGVVFSITIVVLQLASSQFSPRVLRSFTEDRANQLVLGVFIGTFTYALLVLRTVRSEFADYSRFVPTLSVNIAVLLAVISMGFLIYFINHIAHSIQAETIIARVTSDALEVVDRLFPEQVGEGAAESAPELYEHATGEPLLAASRSGFLQSIDAEQVITFAEKHGVVLKLEQPIGSFIVAGDTLISVTTGAVDDGTAEELRDAAVIGAERTRYQDVERGLIELTDIAVRALSPGINDPTTALTCVHRLTEIFTVLGLRRWPPRVRKGKNGAVRVLAPRAEFEELLRLAYGPVLLHGRKNPWIIAAIEASLQRLIERCPQHRHAAITAERARLRELSANSD